jgi:hypothetical protein
MPVFFTTFLREEGSALLLGERPVRITVMMRDRRSCIERPRTVPMPLREDGSCFTTPVSAIMRFLDAFTLGADFRSTQYRSDRQTHGEDDKAHAGTPQKERGCQ